MSLTVGLKGRCEALVTDTNTALAMGSGALPVLATPMMVALMEGAAVDALKGHLAEGEDTVGTGLEISHDAATPVGRGGAYRCGGPGAYLCRDCL